MPHHGFPRRALRAVLLTAALAVASAAWMPVLAQHSHEGQHRSVIVRINNLGVDPVTTDSVRVIVYSAGPDTAEAEALALVRTIGLQDKRSTTV